MDDLEAPQPLLSPNLPFFAPLYSQWASSPPVLEVSGVSSSASRTPPPLSPDSSSLHLDGAYSSHSTHPAGALHTRNLFSLPSLAPLRPVFLYLSLALMRIKGVLISTRKVLAPLLVFGVVGCFHLLGWGLLVYSALTLWRIPGQHAGPLPPSAAPSRLSSAVAQGHVLPLNPSPIIGAVRLADLEGLGLLSYMASILGSFLWLQQYVRTRREERTARERERWRGSGTGPLGA